MIKNYLKIAFRNLQRNKAYSFINILGLTIGLAACLLVSTVVLNDLSYDRQWKNADRIYRIISVNKATANSTDRYAQSLTGFGPTFKKIFPEVDDYCRMSVHWQRLKMGNNKDGVGFKCLSADPTICRLLDFNVTAGTPGNFVKGYTNVVITEKLKAEYFGDFNPVGKTITDMPQSGKPGNYLITGVIKNIPANTHLAADVLVINEMGQNQNTLKKEGYGTLLPQYLLLKPGTPAAAFAQKANKWYQHFTENKQHDFSFYLQPIKDVYLRSADLSGEQYMGDIRAVYIFTGVAVMLLLIACINFVNLTTARALKRVREAGIRTVLGASRRELIAQYLFESLLFFFVSFAAAIVFYNIFLKQLEAYVGHPLPLTLQSNAVMFGATCGIVLIVSILTGTYPALLISVQKPADTLKGNVNKNVGGDFLRKGLVVAQFAISVVILIATIVVQDQLHFLDNKDLGFDKSNLMHLGLTSWDGKGQAFKQEVLGISGVKNATLTTWVPTQGGGWMSERVEDPKQKNNPLTVWEINADFDFIATMKLHLRKGRLLDPKFATDAVNAENIDEKLFEAQKKQPIIVTDFTARTLNIKALNNPVGKVSGIPVGIINDFNNESLKIDMKPLIIRASNDVPFGYLMIRNQPGTDKQVVVSLAKLWRQFFPDKVFQYNWIDGLLKDQYKAEHRLQQLFTLFSFLVLFLASLGLFGLTIFTAELKVKEIGIRKVLGASVTRITVLLSGDFIKPVLLAIVIAAPIGWYAMSKWLQDYPYRISSTWWIFILSALIAVFIAVATISFQTIKAALANPVKSLRSE